MTNPKTFTWMQILERHPDMAETEDGKLLAESTWGRNMECATRRLVAAAAYNLGYAASQDRARNNP